MMDATVTWYCEECERRFRGPLGVRPTCPGCHMPLPIKVSTELNRSLSKVVEAFKTKRAELQEGVDE